MKRRDFVLLLMLSAIAPLAKAGAWESGSFDNDDAQDWAAQCARSKGSVFVSSTLSAVLAEGYVEAPECSAAIAAAEVVAAAKGRPSASLPKELSVWLAQQQKNEITKLAPVASKAMLRVLNGW